MNGLSVIAICLYTIVVLTLATNLMQVFTEAKKLKADNKTPLIGKNIATVVLAAVAEAIFVFIAIALYSNWHISSILAIVLSFASIYLGRNIAAYLAAWGTWSVFVSSAKRKELKKIKQDQQQEGAK